MDTCNQKALSVECLHKSFGRLEAVKGLNLQVEKGEVFGLLGPNGAGKSTTIKIISGLLKASSGIVKIFGKNITFSTTRELIGLCPQEIVIWESLTLMEQLTMMAQMYDIPYRIAKKRSEELLDALGLTEKRNKLASTLSGGMKRRLNILLALMHQPEIVILDEPQAGLDPQSRVLVRDYIRSISKSKTIIITTHDMEEADKLTDRVAIIDNGSILTEGSPQKLKETHFNGEIIEFSTQSGLVKAEIYAILADKFPIQYSEGGICSLVTDKPYDTLKEMEEILKGFGDKPDNVKIRRATLEDVFISLTGRGLRE